MLKSEEEIERDYVIGLHKHALEKVQRKHDNEINPAYKEYLRQETNYLRDRIDALKKELKDLQGNHA